MNKFDAARLSSRLRVYDWVILRGIVRGPAETHLRYRDALWSRQRVLSAEGLPRRRCRGESDPGTGRPREVCPLSANWPIDHRRCRHLAHSWMPDLLPESRQRRLEFVPPRYRHARRNAIRGDRRGVYYGRDVVRPLRRTLLHEDRC